MVIIDGDVYASELLTMLMFRLGWNVFVDANNGLCRVRKEWSEELQAAIDQLQNQRYVHKVEQAQQEINVRLEKER